MFELLCFVLFSNNFTLIVGRQVEIDNFKSTAEYLNYSCSEKPM